MNNFDKLKSMSVDEFAAWIASPFNGVNVCAWLANGRCVYDRKTQPKCKKCWLKWL